MPRIPATAFPLAQLDLRDRAQRTLQQREQEHADAIARYADLYRGQGADALPPIRVVRCENGVHLLTDGWHRVRAALKADLTDLPAIVSEGDLRSALLAALTANGDHGIPTSLAERTAAATTLLEDPEWRRWSDKRIARHAHISPQLVAKIRKRTPGAQVDERETSAGRTQRSVNSRAQATTKDQPAIRVQVGAADVPALDMLAIALRDHPGLDRLPEIKRRILAALWLAGRPVDRDTLAALIDGRPDVHPGQLRRQGLTSGDHAGWSLTDEGIALLRGTRWKHQDGQAYDLDTPGTLGARISAPVIDPPPATATATPEPPELAIEDADDEEENAAPAPAPAPAAAAAPAPTDQAITLRLALADRLERGKPAWRGTDTERLALLVLALTDRGDGQRWGRDLLERADLLLQEALLAVLIDDLRSGDTRLAAYPAIPDLARLLGIDPDTLRIQAGAA